MKTFVSIVVLLAAAYVAGMTSEMDNPKIEVSFAGNPILILMFILGIIVILFDSPKTDNTKTEP